MKQTELKKYKQQFLEHLEVEKNRSRLTIRNYDLYLRRFCEFAESRRVSSPAGVDLDSGAATPPVLLIALLTELF